MADVCLPFQADLSSVFRLMEAIREAGGDRPLPEGWDEFLQWVTSDPGAQAAPLSDAIRRFVRPFLMEYCFGLELAPDVRQELA